MTLYVLYWAGGHFVLGVVCMLASVIDEKREDHWLKAGVRHALTGFMVSGALFAWIVVETWRNAT